MLSSVYLIQCWIRWLLSLLILVSQMNWIPPASSPPCTSRRISFFLYAHLCNARTIACVTTNLNDFKFSIQSLVPILSFFCWLRLRRICCTVYTGFIWSSFVPSPGFELKMYCSILSWLRKRLMYWAYFVVFVTKYNFLLQKSRSRTKTIWQFTITHLQQYWWSMLLL